MTEGIREGLLCLGCGCGFGPGSGKVLKREGKKNTWERVNFNHVFAKPVKRGKDYLCPSCDAMEKKRGYLHPKNYTFSVWDKDRFKEVHLLSYKGIEKAVKAMKSMTPEQRREYLLKLGKE